MPPSITRPTRTNEYIPGICNIGPAERAQRRKYAIIATIVTIVLFIVLSSLTISPLWRLVLFFPAAVAASGYLQDAFHFCAGFGMKGLYNVINSTGMTEAVANDEFRAKDKRKAQSIAMLSIGIGAVVAIVAVIV